MDNMSADNAAKRLYFEENVLNTQEACELLSISRATLLKLVDEEKIAPFKEMANGWLFFKHDLIQYKHKLYKESTVIGVSQNKKIYGDGVTRDAEKEFDILVTNKADVVSIRIYFNEYDAIIDSYFTVTGTIVENKLANVRGPHMIVTLKNGEQLWFNGLLCGYDGAGPGGSKRILTSVGVNNEEDIDKLYKASIIEYYKEDGLWKVHVFRERPLGDTKDEGKTFGQIYFFNNNLILISDTLREWDFNTEGFLRRYSNFLTAPSSVTIMTGKYARETGHYNISVCSETCYQVILKDESGREIWFPFPIDCEKSLLKQESLQNILNLIGMEIDTSCKPIPQRLKEWLSTTLKVKDLTKFVFDLKKAD